MSNLAKLPFRRRLHGRLLMLMLMLLCAAVGMVHAQTAVNADDNSAPPGRVARLSHVAGDLGLLPSGASDWGDASINRPLTTGDKLSSGAGARAELEFGGGTLRMAGQTDLGLLDLDDQLAQIELTQGTLSLSVRHLDQGQSYEIDTPTVAVVIDQPGSLRVDIDNDGHTQVTDFAGTATVYGENNAQRPVLAGRSYLFADSALGAVAISEIGGNDAFGAWAEQRDQRYVQSSEPEYVDDDVVGYQDLDEYGSWEQSDDYGEVWYPARVAADWAPYRNGHWAYIGPWGWTWVDDAPWGFAPYHYGRWAYTQRGWGWIPGPRGVRAIYAPALVAFVGGGGWSIGLAGSPVGWFPLGPRDIYNPWYRCGRECYTRVNAHNLRDRQWHDRDADIRDHYEDYRRGTPMREQAYANRQSPRGFTAVTGQAFANGRQVQSALLHVDAHELAGAPLLTRGTSLHPQAASFVHPRSGHGRTLAAGGFERAVVARHAPPTAGLSQRVAGATRRAGTDNQVRILDTSTRGIESPRAATHANASAEELPSSRFAHSRAISAQASSSGELRNSRSYPGDQRGLERGTAPTMNRDMRTLPQEPRIQRATTMEPTRDSERQLPRESFREPVRQQRDIEQPRAMPRQDWQPRDRQAPRNTPEHRAEPARSKPRAEPQREREHDHRQ